MSNQDLNTPWRKVAATIYGAPRDSKMYGSVEIDVTDALVFIKEQRKQGIKITLTHVLTLIIGKTIAEDVPELNTYTARGKIFERPSLDAMVSVMGRNKEMGAVRIRNVHQHNYSSLADTLNKEIQQGRDLKDAGSSGGKQILSTIPWPFRIFLFRVVRFLGIDLGLHIPLKNSGPNNFGTYILSNIGSVGLDLGFGALLPASNLSIAIFMGKEEKKPVVIDNQMVIRNMLTLSATLDHRVVDGQHGGLLFKGIKRRLKSFQNT